MLRSKPSSMSESVRLRLAALGASNLDASSGVIPVSSGQELRVLETKTVGTTPLWESARPHLLGLMNERIRLSRSMSLSFLQKPCSKTIPPNILMSLIPFSLVNMQFHVFSLKLSGDIQNRFGNDSFEAKQGTTSVKKWQSCPSDDSAYSWSTVSGSADLVPNWNHSLADDQSGATLAKVSQSIDKIGISTAAIPQVSWQSGGLGDLIWQIVQILVSGSITTRNGFDVTASYSWQGSQSKSQHIDARVVVPVSGSIQWAWN